jgi:hypothetical protein
LPELYSALDRSSLISQIPRSLIIGFRAASRCNLDITEVLQLEKRPEPVQEIGSVLAFC